MAEITRQLGDWIRALIEYNPITGEFFWLISQGRAKTGDQAGSIYKNGYRYIQISGLDYRAGRLAWFFVTGEDPLDFVDHKNKDRDDNRFDNLRRATNSQNQANTAPKNTSTSGLKGVSWQPSRGKWIAMITVNGRAKNLGRFDSVIDAAKTYRKAAIEAWGEFALVPSDEEILAVAAELDLSLSSNLSPEELDL